MAEITNDVREFDETPYVQDSSVLTKGEQIKGFLKRMVNGQKFDDKKVPPAYKAYLSSRYGEVFNNNKRVDEYMARLAGNIFAKQGSREFAILDPIPMDIIEYKQVLIDFFRKKGYVCHDLADVIPGLTNSYIFLEWGNFKACQDALADEVDLEKITENLEKS